MSTRNRMDDDSDGPSRYAPKWLRDERSRRRPQRPMRLPEAPQLVVSDERPQSSDDRHTQSWDDRNTQSWDDRDAFEGDVAIRQMLMRQSLSPQVVPEPPRWERQRSHLGMIVRLSMAIAIAFAAAVVLVQMFPIRSMQPSTEGRDVAVASAKTGSSGSSSQREATPFVKSGDRVSDRPAATPEPASRNGATQEPASRNNVVNGGAAVASASAPVAAAATPALASQSARPWPVPTQAPTPSPTVQANNVVALQSAPATTAPSESSQRELQPDEIDMLLRRGESFVAEGDIAAARLVLQRAAEARDARAALALGATYDPNALKKLGVIGVKPDITQARAWYEKAAEFGSSEAPQRISSLPQAR